MKLALKPVAIGEIVERSQTWNPSRSSADEVFQYIDLSAVDQDAKVITGAREVPCGEAPSRARQLVESGDILVSTVRPNLNGVARVPEQLDGATASTGFCVLRANKTKANGAYLFHWVKSPAFITDMVSKATGASYPAVSDRIIFDSQIPLPPLAEQKRIAAILDAADALRAKRREALAQLDALLQSSFLTLFGDPVSNPMGWPEVEFETIVESTKLGLVRGSTEFGWDMPVPYVRMDAITNDGQFLPEKVQGTNASKEEIKTYSLRSGDFLLNTRNSKELVGKITVFRGQKGWTFNNNIIRIRFLKNVEPDVISTQFRFPRVKQALENRKAGTTSVFAIYWKELKTLPVLHPPLPLQQKFAAIVESIERQKTTQRAHLTELDALFAALQHRAFRGEL